MPRASFEQGGEGGRGFWTQNLVYQKWPDQIIPIVKFRFFPLWSLWSGEGGRGFWGRPPPALIFNYSKEALAVPPTLRFFPFVFQDPETPPPPPPCDIPSVVAPLRGPGRSPVLPFACCVGSLLSVGRCGRCSCWCRFHVREAQPPPLPPARRAPSG